MEFVILIWLGLAVAIGVGASNRGRSGFGWFVLAVIASPLIAGILLIVLGDRTQLIERERRARLSRPCPHCAELVLFQASICPHCRSDLSASKADLLAKQEGLARRQRAQGYIMAGILIAILIALAMFPQKP